MKGSIGTAATDINTSTTTDFLPTVDHLEHETNVSGPGDTPRLTHQPTAPVVSPDGQMPP